MTLAIEGRLTLEGLSEIAGVAAAALGWDAEQTNREIEDVAGQLRRFHGQTLTNRAPGEEQGKPQRPASR